MSRLFSILFAILLLCNSLGYYGIFVVLKYQNDVEMMQKLDRSEYSESDMITIKIPISIPYATDSQDFERADGLIEHEGEFYRMVKQRMLQDTLHVVCVKDYELAYINQSWEDYVKTFNDNHSDKTGAKTLQTLIKDYLSRTFSILRQSPGWECDVVQQSYVSSLISDFYPSIIHPPERTFAWSSDFSLQQIYQQPIGCTIEYLIKSDGPDIFR